MASLISIRLNDELLLEIRRKAHILHLSQAEYVREAILRLNATLTREEREQRLKKASLQVRANSMDVNKDFSEIENDPDS
jgi:hypothetical protein